MNKTIHPFGKLFTILTKQYVNLLSKRLEGLPIDRYFHPLYLIHQSNGNISQNELAEKLFVDKVTVVRIIDYLEKNGLAYRLQHPNDRRSHVLSVSNEGASYIPMIEVAMLETNEVFLEYLSEPFKSLFQSEITKLADEVCKIPGKGFDVIINKVITSE